jgi:hypothetical protein
MNAHENARLTPRRRQKLVTRLDAAEPLEVIPRRLDISLRTAVGALLVVVLLLLASVGTVSAECACLRLRIFSPEERQQLETQLGVNWWKTMGLIPGPQTPSDWVERPAGDSSIVVFSPQQFWDPRTCAHRRHHRPAQATDE